MKNSLLVAACMIMLLNSCKKENVTAPGTNGNGGGNPVPGVKLLKKSDIWLNDLAFEYNPDNTIRKMTWKLNGFNYIANFKYENGKIFRDGFQDGSLLERDTVTLENNRMVKLARTYWQNGSPLQTNVTNYQYTNGLLTKTVFSNGDYIMNDYNAEGDLVTMSMYNQFDLLTEKREYQYYPQIEKNPYYNQCRGGFFFLYQSPTSKHVMKGYKQTNYISPGVKEFSYTYEYDADGYTVKSTGWDVAWPAMPWYSTNVY